MANHPNRSQYPTPAPCFANYPDPVEPEIIGEARTQSEARVLFERYFADSGLTVTRVFKVCPELRDQGPVDGWAAETSEA